MSGSVWNKNSWHWEEKNYNKWGESYIENKLKQVRIQKDAFIIYLERINIKGSTSVSIRKGKQIASFEYVITFNWIASKEDTKKEWKGDVEINDFSNCSLEDNDYEVVVSKNSDEKESTEAYTIFKKDGVDMIRNLLKNFLSDLLKHDTNESNKELKLLEEEDKKLKNLPKQDNEMDDKKKVEALKIESNDNKKEGSIWNINNYHWEERCLTKWAQETLKNIFETSEIELSNYIFLKFFDCTVSGEASSSIRKQKKILIYDLKITTEWKAYKKTKNEEIEQEAKGHVSISEILSDFACDDETLYKYNFIFDNKGPEFSMMNDVIGKEGPKEINKIIDTFITQMKEK